MPNDRRTLANKARAKHGARFNGKSTNEYISWVNMKQRCLNEKCPTYKNYGGRGISVDPQWMEFSEFYKDMGKCPPGFTLERVDNTKGYAKRNCVWASRIENNRNTRLVIRFRVGQRNFNSLTEYAEHVGVGYGVVYGEYRKYKHLPKDERLKRMMERFAREERGQ